MPETVTVASRAHTAVQIIEPQAPGDYKPGITPAPKSAIIHGARHPAALGEVGITEGVDADLFHKWSEANKGTDLGNALTVLTGDALERAKKGEQEFGFEPAMKRAEADSAKAAEGSTVTHGGPVKAEEMAATSDTPNDDSPRSQSKIL